MEKLRKPSEFAPSEKVWGDIATDLAFTGYSVVSPCGHEIEDLIQEVYGFLIRQVILMKAIGYTPVPCNIIRDRIQPQRQSQSGQ